MLDKEMKIDKKAVGLRIRHIRLSKGYTLEAFGKFFNAAKSNVQNWEVGKYLPNKKRLKVLCQLANISLEELLYGGSEQDIEELYERLIRLSNDEILNIMERVTEYMKERRNDYRKH